MPVIRVAMAVILLFVMIPSIGVAQDRSSTPITREEVDAKINELRALYNSQIVPKPEIDAKFNALRQQVDLYERVGQEAGRRLGARLDYVEYLTGSPGIVAFLPVLGAPVAALISAAFLWWIAWKFTHRFKMVDATLEFSKRFGELIERQGELNRKFAEDRIKNGKKPDEPPTIFETNEAVIWWWRFFDMIMYEYDFFRQGLVWDERFVEWMKWRWHDFNATGSEIMVTNGMAYKEGWRRWSTNPANDRNNLIPFLNAVHIAPTEAVVAQLVAAQKPRSGWREDYHLKRGTPAGA